MAIKQTLSSISKHILGCVIIAITGKYLSAVLCVPSVSRSVELLLGIVSGAGLRSGC